MASGAVEIKRRKGIGINKIKTPNFPSRHHAGKRHRCSRRRPGFISPSRASGPCLPPHPCGLAGFTVHTPPWNPSYRHRRVETGSDGLAPPCAAPPSRWSGAAGRIPRRASLASPDRRCAIVAGHSAAAIGKRKGIGERRNLGAKESPAAMLLLQQGGDRVLSPEDVRYLAGVLLAEQKPSPQPVRKKSTWPLSDGKMRSMIEQRRISRNVKVTLNQHFLRDGKPMYKLHVICGTNDSVCSPEYYCSKQEDCLSFAPCDYKYTHVNFLATEKDEGEPAVMCCKGDMPLPFAEHVRCLYCEVEEAKVVHPALEKFHGGDREFEEVIRGKHSLTNSWIICLNEYAVQRLYAHNEDFMYGETNIVLSAMHKRQSNIFSLSVMSLSLFGDVIFMSSYWLHFWSTMLSQEEHDTMCNGATLLKSKPEMYTHVNFLATEKSASPSSPVLFFAEFDNEKAEGESPVLCCKVDMPLPCADNLESMSVKNIGNVEYNTTKHLMTFKFTPGKVVFTSQWHANV
uniref:DUF3615 domain-containing protein n=1 Tax=Oryza nivara TaxID=4536 RepID=A0A0E0IP44_ORYNI